MAAIENYDYFPLNRAAAVRTFQGNTEPKPTMFAVINAAGTNAEQTYRHSPGEDSHGDN